MAGSTVARQSLALNQKECTSSPGGPISATPFGSCACAIASGLKVSHSKLDLTSLCHQVPSEQMMERSPGRSGARVRHILGERLLRRLDEDMDVVRREREVRIKFLSNR